MSVFPLFPFSFSSYRCRLRLRLFIQLPPHTIHTIPQLTTVNNITRANDSRDNNVDDYGYNIVTGDTNQEMLDILIVPSTKTIHPRFPPAVYRPSLLAVFVMTSVANNTIGPG